MATPGLSMLTPLLAQNAMSVFDAAAAAARDNRLDDMRRMLASGLDAAACALDGVSLLHIAAMNGHAEMCSLLIKHGARIEAQDVSKENVLHVAALCRHDAVCALLASQCDQRAVDAATVSGATPLHLCVLHRLEKACEVLLRVGANYDAQMVNGMRIMCVPTSDAIKRMLQRAKHERETRLSAPIQRLLESSARGDVGGIEATLAAGARVTDADHFGDTALHRAALYGHAHACIVLIERGASPNSRNHAGWTAVHSALWGTHAVIADLLCQRGGNRMLRDHKGRTADELLVAPTMPPPRLETPDVTAPEVKAAVHANSERYDTIKGSLDNSLDFVIVSVDAGIVQQCATREATSTFIIAHKRSRLNDVFSVFNLSDCDMEYSVRRAVAVCGLRVNDLSAAGTLAQVWRAGLTA